MTSAAAGPWSTERRASVSPAGVPVVCVHGAMDRASSFAMASRRLPDHDVVRYDRRGYGRSAGLAPGDLGVQVEDLLALVGPGAVVVGHSVGALVALAAACASDRVLAVAALEPPMPWRSWFRGGRAGSAARTAEDPGAAAEAFLRRMLGDAAWERLPARTRAERRAEGPALLADLALARAGRPYDPAALVGRVVVARGSRTDERHAWAVATLRDEVPGTPEVVVEGASHGLHRSHPDETADVVRRAAALVDAVGTIRP